MSSYFCRDFCCSAAMRQIWAYWDRVRDLFCSFPQKGSLPEQVPVGKASFVDCKCKRHDIPCVTPVNIHLSSPLYLLQLLNFFFYLTILCPITRRQNVIKVIRHANVSLQPQMKNYRNICNFRFPERGKCVLSTALYPVNSEPIESYI